MKKANVAQIMEFIKDEKGDCVGYFPNQLAMAFMLRYSSALEKALLKLLTHAKKSVRSPAYCALSKRRKKLSPLALEKLEKFKKKPRNKGVLETAREQFNILP
jgi:hypothetical protein